MPPPPIDPFQRTQLDVAARLRACLALRDITIQEMRPRSEAEALGIADAVNNALAGLQTDTTRAGLTILVPVPEFKVREPNLPAPFGDVIVQVQILENTLINEGENGSGLSAEGAAIEVMRALHHCLLRPNALLYGDKIEALDIDDSWSADLAVGVWCKMAGGFDPAPQCHVPLIENSGGNITVTTTTSGAACLVTLDGSYPHAGNSAAIPVSAPFPTPASGTVIRAVATRPDLDDSGANWLQIA
jgi:hypothetical protein